MAKNKISDLRDHLFETLEDLKDKDAPMDLDRARAIRDVAQTLINAAKVEVDYLRTAGELLGQTVDFNSEFFPGHRPALPPGPPGNGNGGNKR